MSRTILGLVAGTVTAFACVFLVETIGHLVYPVPADLGTGNEDQMAAFVRGLPLGALAFVAAGWFLGALAGGSVAAVISRRRWASWLIGGLVAAAAIVTILMIPHPEWMQVSALIVPLLGATLGGHFAARNQAPERSPTGAADAQI
jgi:hypothetical protein